MTRRDGRVCTVVLISNQNTAKRLQREGYYVIVKLLFVLQELEYTSFFRKFCHKCECFILLEEK